MAAQSYTTSTTIKARVGITDATDDTIIGTLAGQVNSWVEGRIGFPVGPITSEARLFDGDAIRQDHTGTPYLAVAPWGCRSISAVRTADATDGTYTSRTAGDVVIRPHTHERETDWPGFRLYVKDTASWSWNTGGYDVNEVTATWGWAAIPDELKAIADKLGVAAFRGRAHGSGSTFSVGAEVEQIAAEELTASDWRTIGKYADLKARIW